MDVQRDEGGSDRQRYAQGTVAGRVGPTYVYYMGTPTKSYAPQQGRMIGDVVDPPSMPMFGDTGSTANRVVLWPFHDALREEAHGLAAFCGPRCREWTLALVSTGLLQHIWMATAVPRPADGPVVADDTLGIGRLLHAYVVRAPYGAQQCAAAHVAAYKRDERRTVHAGCRPKELI